MYSSNYAIEVTNVSKVYQIYDKPINRLKDIIFPSKKNIKQFQALKNISMKIEKGTTVGIVGRNGSGKSTILQIISGTLSPSVGEVKVQGRIAALLELGAGFNPEFTGRENVYLNGSILGIPKNVIDKRFSDIIDFADIGEFIDRPVKTYSSGMFVRLAFSVATLTDPDVVIIDEALSVGDEKFQRKCYNHLEMLKNKGCTILFVSHSMKIVEQLCDYAYLLDSGQLIAHGKPKEIIDKYHLLLYSNENQWIKAVQESQNKNKDTPNTSLSLGNVTSKENKQAEIIRIEMFNSADEESYIFLTGDRSEIRIEVMPYEDLSDVIVGIRIKTTQGVEVYGTSTIYTKETIDLKKGTPIQISFQQNLNLVAGTYHLSVAIAKKIGNSDMKYLDKKSDFVIFKVEEIPITGTGIANLRSIIVLKESQRV